MRGDKVLHRRSQRAGLVARLSHLAITTYLMSIIVGCDPDASNRTDAGVGDASPSADAPSFELVLTGKIDGDDLLVGQVGGIAVNPTGRIYVADVLPVAQTVAVFDSSGVWIRAFGTPGRGPGEFNGLQGELVWLDGVLATVDREKVILFGPDGGVADTWRWPGAARFGTLLVGAGSELIGREFIPQSGSPIPEVRYVRHTREGAPEESEVPVPDMHWPWSVQCLRTDELGFIEILSVPFARWAEVPALTPEGNWVVARRDEYRMDVYDLQSGSLVRTVTRAVPPVPMTDSLWEGQPEVAEVRRYERTGRLVVPEDRSEACPFDSHRPEHLPVIRTVLADEMGNLWVESATEQGFQLTVFDPAGGILGVTEMPERDPRVRPYVRNYQLYIVTADSLGVQSLQRYQARGRFP